MSDEITSDEKPSNDEKSSGLGKLESLSNEELIRLVKTHIILKKKFETKINELTNSHTSLNQIEELRNEIDQNKMSQSKLQEELNITHESLECFRLQNETLKSSCQNFQDEIFNLQKELSIVRSSLINESQKFSSQSELLSNSISIVIDLFQLPISLPDSIDGEFLKMYKNELEQKQENDKQLFEQIEQDKNHLQQRIEDLEFLNEEIKLEIDDLRLKSRNYQHDKQLMEKEIDNYRRQIEDFEEQFLELQRESHDNHYDNYEKVPQQSSITSSILTFHQSDENFDEIIFQCMNSILNQIDDQNQHISKASSTSSLLLSSDIPTLLHSVGITNCTDEDFSIPLNFESVIHLCTLLIERCRVLQYILLKNNDISLNSLIDNSYDKDCVVFSQNNHYEQCKILIHKQDHIALDTLFERIYTGMNQIISSNDWQIIIEKPIDQNISPSIRLKFDNFQFVSEKIEQDLIRLRSQYDQLSKENEKQRNEISLLEKRLHSNNSYEQLKERQTQLEEQLAKQCEKTTQLENILTQENIDKARLSEIENSYRILQEKYHIAEQLEEQLKQQKDLFEKLKIDYDHQHFHLLERDENIRLLKLELEEHEQSKENLIEKYQNEINKIQNQFEQQKFLLLNTTENQDQRYLLISKQQDQLNNLIQIKIDENKNLFEKNLQLEKNFQKIDQILLEKNQQIDHLKKQFDLLNIEYEEFQIHFNQLKEEKNKLVNEINLLMDKITILEKNKLESIQDQTNLSELEIIRKENEKLHQIINELKEKQNPESNENIQELKEKYQKMKMLLTRLKKELQEKNYQPKQSSIDLELADYEKTIQNLKKDLTNKDKDLQDLRDELLNSTEKYSCLKLEISNLEQQKLQTEERANKFKALLDMAKKELHSAKNLELQRHNNDDHLQELIEKLQNQLESNKVLISELTNEKQQLTEKLNNQIEISQKTIHLLEQNLSIAKHDLDIVKQDYDTLQDDFNSYKIRAQSVLKQHQSNQRERTPSLADKQVELEETIEKFKSTLQEANNKIQLLISENEVLQKEQDRLIEIQAKLLNESKKREQDLRKQHQIDIDKIKNEYLQRINDSHDMLKNVTLQNETISIAFKEQITTIESDHERSISILQNQLQISEQEIEELKIRIELLRQTNLDNEKLLTSNSESSQIGIKNDSNRDNTLAWSTHEHQQGETSQSTNIEHQSPHIPVKTIEKVQVNGISTIQNNTTMNNHSIPSSPSDKLGHISFENIELERKHMEEEFNKIKLRLIHTTELLNESELNNERLNEQVSFLKDEIRRIERNMDRAESISNLEYLKNIIIKFLVLKSTPERLQLIPVLVTMLKLSPDEQAQLVSVANIATISDEKLRSDESPSQQITNGANSPSWSSYLNIW